MSIRCALSASSLQLTGTWKASSCSNISVYIHTYIPTIRNVQYICIQYLRTWFPHDTIGRFLWRLVFVLRVVRCVCLQMESNCPTKRRNCFYRSGAVSGRLISSIETLKMTSLTPSPSFSLHLCSLGLCLLVLKNDLSLSLSRTHALKMSTLTSVRTYIHPSISFLNTYEIVQELTVNRLQFDEASKNAKDTPTQTKDDIDIKKKKKKKQSKDRLSLSVSHDTRTLKYVTVVHSIFISAFSLSLETTCVCVLCVCVMFQV